MDPPRAVEGRKKPKVSATPKVAMGRSRRSKNENLFIRVQDDSVMQTGGEEMARDAIEAAVEDLLENEAAEDFPPDLRGDRGDDCGDQRLTNNNPEALQDKMTVRRVYGTFTIWLFP